ncbi:hypothetical protein QWZ14_16740 [Paeniroseomonas aquatica]|uniref:Uncharacterized protein n=1 Tax=Paeniroseomonas aquatica TaxID=373043 RepID=A0ABT8A877_9PROT|nr:hypothetical protein [Paeniroseomonas aquatica]MDN3566018.1 hypothetical protein [Paeniroseomonas aquatica]
MATSHTFDCPMMEQLGFQLRQATLRQERASTSQERQQAKADEAAIRAEITRLSPSRRNG